MLKHDWAEFKQICKDEWEDIAINALNREEWPRYKSLGFLGCL